MSTPLTLAELRLHPSLFVSSKMLLSMTEVDETESFLHTFEYRKMKGYMILIIQLILTAEIKIFQYEIQRYLYH